MSTRVEIEYCVPCGHLERAIETQRSILGHFGRRVEDVALKTGDGVVFTIRADDEEIYDRPSTWINSSQISNRASEPDHIS